LPRGGGRPSVSAVRLNDINLNDVVQECADSGGCPVLSFLELLLTASRGQRIPLVYFVEVISNECVLRVSCPGFGAGLLMCPMPKGLRRYYGQRHLHFITCSSYRRLPLLRSAHAKNERERSKTAKPCAR